MMASWPGDSRTPAQSAGCCLAPSKQLCSRPPCPCNLDTYTAAELYNLKLRPGDGRVRMATDARRTPGA